MTIFLPTTFQFACRVLTSDLTSTVIDLAFLSKLRTNPRLFWLCNC